MKQKRIKISSGVFWFGLMLVLLAAAVIPVWKTGILSDVGRENIYWERARYLLDQRGLSDYNGETLCSLGYSILLLPICAVIQSPYAAFKAALILNGIFLAGSYAVSFAVAKKMFPEERKSLLSIICFFVTACPVLAVERLQTGPESAVMLLTWAAILFVSELKEHYSARWLILLSMDLILIGFLQISALGIITGVMVVLGFMAKKDQIPMTSYLRALLALLLGLAAGNIAERIVLYGFASDMDVTVTSSLEVLFSQIAAGWTNGYVTGLLENLAGKLYSLITVTFLLICPGLWVLCKKGRVLLTGEKRNLQVSEMIEIVIGVSFLLQLVLSALTANASGNGTDLVSLSGISVSAVPVLMIGVIDLKKNANWERELLGWLLAACICTFIAASAAGTIDTTVQKDIGFLYIPVSGGLTSVAGIYVTGCAALLAGILIFAGIRGKHRNRTITRGLRVFGVCMLCAAFLGGGFWLEKRAVLAFSEASMEQEAVVASLLQRMGSETKIYCLMSDSTAKKNSVILQSLVPQIQLHEIENNAQKKAEFFDTLDKQPENLAVITTTEENLIYQMQLDKLTDFQLVYVAGDQAIWVRDGSSAWVQAEEAAQERIMRLDGMPQGNVLETAETSEDETVQTESQTQSFGNGVVLAPGTYRMEIILKKSQDVSDFTGEITVDDENGKITGIGYGAHNFAEDGTGMVSLEFTDRNPMRNVTVTVTAQNTTGIRVEEIRYRKYMDAYMIGCEDQTSVILTGDMIRELDQISQTQGSVVYVDGKAQQTEDISLERFATQLDGYELKAVTLDELSGGQTDYLISDTASHDYYSVMDDYSIIYRDDAFTLLVRKDSTQGVYADSKDLLLSDGRQIDVRCYTGTDKNAGKSIALEKGTYEYHLQVECGRKLTEADSAIVGSVRIRSGKNIIASRNITAKELNERSEIQLPFSLVSAVKQLKCDFEPTENFNSEVKVTVTPLAVELKARDYQYGTETEELDKWYRLFEHTEGSYSVAVVSLAKNMVKGLSDLSDLQGRIGDRKVKEITYEEAFASKEDRYLITYDFAARAMKLLNDYTIVDQIGQYTLLVRSDGALLDVCREKEYGALSSGSRFRPQVIASTRGKEYTEGQIDYLPTGRYCLTLELEASDLTVDDTVEVYLMRDKTSKELSEERTTLEDSGYTDDEIEAMLEKRIECGSLTCDGYRFDGSERIVITIETDKKCKITDLTAEAYSWQGKKAEAKILWVEMV